MKRPVWMLWAVLSLPKITKGNKLLKFKVKANETPLEIVTCWSLEIQKTKTKWKQGLLIYAKLKGIPEVWVCCFYNDSYRNKLNDSFQTCLYQLKSSLFSTSISNVICLFINVKWYFLHDISKLQHCFPQKKQTSNKTVWKEPSLNKISSCYRL